MTYQQRKEHEVCTYPGCSSPCTDETFTCETHREAANARVREHLAEKRARLRAAGRCVDCERRSRTYRCACCRGLIAPSAAAP